MIDLDPAMRSAHARSEDWTQVRLSHALRAVVSLLPGSLIEWEPGDEEWARILLSGELVALVCAKVPLGFGLAAVTQLADLLPQIVWVPVNSMEEHIFSTDQTLLEQIFGRELDTLDYSCISANELWWATVS